MENGIFGRLAVESHEEEVVAYDVAEDVLSEEAYADAMSISAEINADVASMNQAVVAAGRLESQISVESQALEAPESIAASSVVLSQESLASVAMLLGAPAQHTVSNEAAIANPVSALTVSNEGVKDFLKKVIESIKAIFKKVMNSAKKLFVKLVVAMDGTAKKAKAMIKSADKLKGEPKNKEFDEKETKTIALSFGSALALAGKDASVAEITTIVKDLGKVTAMGQFPSMPEVPTDVKDVKGAAAINQKAQADYEKALKALGDYNKTLADKFNYNEPDAKGAVLATVVVKKGTTVKIVESYIKDNEAEDLVFGVKSLSVDKTIFDDKKMAAPTVAEIKTILGEVATKAKGLDKVKNDAMKFIDQADKDLDKLAKDSEGSYIVNKLKAGAATRQRDVATGVALDEVLAYASTTKAALSFASKGMSNFGGSEM